MNPEKMHYGGMVVLAGVLAVLTVCAASSLADVKLPAVIGDNMVLQQGVNVPIWGWAEPGEQIVIKFGLSSIAWGAVTGQDGKWVVKIEPGQAGGPYDMIIEGENQIVLKNVLVGEVWVCSGQSNMEMPLGNVNPSVTYDGVINYEKEIAEANYPNICLFNVESKKVYVPRTADGNSWCRCSPETVKTFSATAYFFGRQLHQQLDVPVGLISACFGGTPAEAWTSRKFLETERDFRGILHRYDRAVAIYPKVKKKYEQELKKFEQIVAKAKAEGKKVPRQPAHLRQQPMGPGHPHAPGGLYNAMIAPLIPHGIRGAIWYQGEANAGRAYQYRKLFPTMIKNWRNDWGQGDFPFLFVQLANFMSVSPEPTESEWAELREAQLMTLSLPRTGMAVIIDIGEADDIHPKNKQDVGSRLALWALAKIYGKDMVYSGPIYKSMDIDGNKVALHFKHTGGGLEAKGGPLKGFAIAGADRKFVWADAKIEGDTVVVSSEEVAEPVAVRYAWANNPVCNLYNAEGLPASPFRTDIWPGLTAERK